MGGAAGRLLLLYTFLGVNALHQGPGGALDLPNVALGKTVRLSGGAQGEKATDGRLHAFFEDTEASYARVEAAKGGGDKWMEIDLVVRRRLESVEVWTPELRCHTALSTKGGKCDRSLLRTRGGGGLRVMVGGGEAGAPPATHVFSWEHTVYAWPRVRAQGTWVRITMPGAEGALSVAEVVVRASSGSAVVCGPGNCARGGGTCASPGGEGEEPQCRCRPDRAGADCGHHLLVGHRYLPDRPSQVPWWDLPLADRFFGDVERMQSNCTGAPRFTALPGGGVTHGAGFGSSMMYRFGDFAQMLSRGEAYVFVGKFNYAGNSKNNAFCSKIGKSWQFLCYFERTSKCEKRRDKSVKVGHVRAKSLGKACGESPNDGGGAGSSRRRGRAGGRRGRGGGRKGGRAEGAEEDGDAGGGGGGGKQESEEEAAPPAYGGAGAVVTGGERCDRMGVLPPPHDAKGLFWLRALQSRYLLRMNGDAAAEVAIARVKGEIGFAHPIVGVHVRGGDGCRFGVRARIGCRKLEDYLPDIRTMASKYGVRRVFVATDSAAVLAAARQGGGPRGGGGLEFIAVPSDRRAFDFQGDKIEKRLVKKTLGLDNHAMMVATLRDMYLLSECDYLVTHQASTLSRLALQLAAATKEHVPPYVSVDGPWCPHWRMCCDVLESGESTTC